MLRERLPEAMRGLFLSFLTPPLYTHYTVHNPQARPTRVRLLLRTHDPHLHAMGPAVAVDVVVTAFNFEHDVDRVM